MSLLRAIQCAQLLAASLWSLTEIFTHFLDTKGLAVQWDFYQGLWAASICQLSVVQPAPLTPLADKWLLHGGDKKVIEGWPEVHRFSELGHDDAVSMAVCLHRQVWKRTAHGYLHDSIYWILLLFIADQVLDVQSPCRQIYTTEFAHGPTSNAP